MMELKFSMMSRRQFLYLSSMSAAGLLVGCAKNPVTGKSQFMLVSRDQEIQMDKQHSPHQFSSDYGTSQDKRLNAYVSEIGMKLGNLSHRPKMPYSFRVVNANYVNAYAFPGGSIAATRGIMLKMKNEGELAALMGHELGHVNARHTAEIMSKSQVTNLVVGSVGAYVGTKGSFGKMAAQLGMMGSGALLASYSRDNERQADGLGMEYLVKGGYSPDGMVGLMNILNTMSKGKHSAAQLLFSTHPMSSERYNTSVKSASNDYGAHKKKPLHRERYMDNIVGLRRIQGAIDSMQKGEAEMAKENFSAAQGLFQKELKQAPNDYAGLVLMAKCQLAQEKMDGAEPYLKKALEVYPQEGQVNQLDGFIKLKKKKFDQALTRFNTYDKQLPGNPTITFFKGEAYEGKGAKNKAGDHFYKYLQVVKKGSNAEYAHKRLVEWKYDPRK